MTLLASLDRISSAWLFDGENFMRGNGVDVIPFVDAELERVAAMPVGTVDVSVGGEWSFAQTLRHLVLATDMWLGRAVLEVDQPFHPLGLADASAQDDRSDMSVLTTSAPSYDDVLEARASRVAMVRDFITNVAPDDLAVTRENPHDPKYPETTLSCLPRSSRRSGNTTATPCGTSTRSRRSPANEPVTCPLDRLPTGQCS